MNRVFEALINRFCDYCIYTLANAKHPLFFETYTYDKRPVRIQIGLPEQSQLDLVEHVVETYHEYTQVAAGRGFGDCLTPEFKARLGLGIYYAGNGSMCRVSSRAAQYCDLHQAMKSQCSCE